MRAACAAAEALVFPVEAQRTPFAPSSTAFTTAITIPRSLNEPVGLHPSSFKWSSRQPNNVARHGARTSGVSPSPKEVIGVRSFKGK